MSVLTRNRIFVLTAAMSLMAASSLFASWPTARTQARMVYDRTSTNVILFGGESPNDSGTKTAYALDETWLWNGARWLRIFPSHSPGGRSAFAFVYDTNRNRALLFGGAAVKTELNDTWAFKNGDWTKIDTPNSPPARVYAGGAFDPVRDRFVIFGGSHTTTNTTTNLSTVTAYADTWEFDGTNWVQRGGTGPAVNKPLLVYDEARAEVLMLGIDNAGATLMYRYKADTGTWEAITPATKPACVNEAGFIYNPIKKVAFVTGGVCTTSDALIEDDLEWDGTNWTKLAPTAISGAGFGQAMAFDELHGVIVQFGGTEAFGLPQNRTYVFRDNAWVVFSDNYTPGPRSLFALRGDEKNNTMWLFGGFNESDTFTDFWKYQNGAWTKQTTTGGPATTCITPNSAYDSDRGKLIVICSDSSTFEWDGATWTAFPVDEKKFPIGRRFSSMVYDRNLKKTVLFGGFHDPDYLDITWTWDGTNWSQVKKNLPTARSLQMMWFDPIMNRTVIYGGLGRQHTEDRISRYSDMWSFDGSGWTLMKEVTATPGVRYGAQVAVDPVTKKAILFGGLRTDITGTLQTQTYVNDTWEWDGNAKTWTKLTTATTPPARENGFFDYDPSRGALTLFGGFSGFYHSDVWSFKDGNWVFVAEPAIPRRRSAGK
jgi:hypothetical protein